MTDEEKRFGYSKDSTYGLMMVSAYAEWVFRISIVAVSCLQMLILRQTTSKYCIEEFGVLALENEWLQWLVGAQVVKISILAMWQMRLYEQKRSE